MGGVFWTQHGTWFGLGALGGWLLGSNSGPRPAGAIGPRPELGKGTGAEGFWWNTEPSENLTSPFDLHMLARAGYTCQQWRQQKLNEALLLSWYSPEAIRNCRQRPRNCVLAHPIELPNYRPGPGPYANGMTPEQLAHHIDALCLGQAWNAPPSGPPQVEQYVNQYGVPYGGYQKVSPFGK